MDGSEFISCAAQALGHESGSRAGVGVTLLEFCRVDSVEGSLNSMGGFDRFPETRAQDLGAR